MSIRMFALATAMTVGASAATAQTSYDCGDPANFELQLCIDACSLDVNVLRQACVNLNAANASSASNLGLPNVGGPAVTNFTPFIIPGLLAAGAVAAIAGGGSTTSTN